MRVVHEPAGQRDGGSGRTVLATEVTVADNFLSQLRGLRFRSSLPDGFALVFPFGGIDRRDIDMLFVRTPIDVLWVVEERVERVETLNPWLGFGLAKADSVIELPPGVAEDVSTGDRVVIESDGE